MTWNVSRITSYNVCYTKLLRYQKLIELRKQLPVMVYGNYQPLFAEHPQVFAYERRLDGQRVVVINNFGTQSLELDLPAELQGLQGECLISNYGPRSELGQFLSLEPYESFAILVGKA